MGGWKEIIVSSLLSEINNKDRLRERELDNKIVFSPIV